MRHRKTWLRLVSAAGLLAVCLTLAACAPGAPAQETARGGGGDHAQVEMTLPTVDPVELGAGERMRVVATTSILGDVAANVGGDAIDLTVLIGIGQDPHSYEPTPQALAAVEDAHLILVNGLGLEEVLLQSIENTATGVVVPVSAGIEPLAFGGGEHAGGDPHFWMDPANVIVWTENIERVLSEADPANRDRYAANAQAYRAALEEVDAYARQQIALIPEANRKLVTDHESLGYFADAYGFEVIGTVIPGTSTTAGASAGDVAALVDVVREQGVPAVFVGSSASRGLQDLANTIAEEVGGEVRVLPLLTGSLAPEGQPGDTYLGLIRYDVDQIVAGLAE